MKPLGYVIHKGPSPIDGRPIVVILTLRTSNRKTGKMCQVWILREDVNPVHALRTGDDYSICGSCPHRKQADGSRSCYVNVGQAPLSVWKAYKRGRYDTLQNPQEIASVLRKASIRWGAYGDPGLLPVGLINDYNRLVLFHTGYTHQWRQPFAHDKIGIFQASTDGLLDTQQAQALGWKTFTVVTRNATPTYAKQCPATVDGSQAQCSTCKLCNGARANVFVNAHGTGSKFVTVH